MFRKTMPLYLASTIIISSLFVYESRADDSVKACLETNRSRLERCSASFNDPESPDYYNQIAFEICNNGATAELEACLNGNSGAVSDFNLFVTDIRACFTAWPNGGDSFKSCLEAALMAYRARLGLPPIDPCGLTSVGTARVAQIDAIYDAAIALGAADGKYPVEVESVLSFQAGVSATNSYNLAGRPCIKQAELIAIYETKAGPHLVALDADLDTSDGTHFDFPVFANEVIDASSIFLVAVYYDVDSQPVFLEYAHLSIAESPVQGDWNRDEVLNSQDIIDFLASYDAQTKRADINSDTQVNPQDAVEFINSTP